MFTQHNTLFAKGLPCQNFSVWAVCGILHSIYKPVIETCNSLILHGYFKHSKRHLGYRVLAKLPLST